MEIIFTPEKMKELALKLKEEKISQSQTICAILSSIYLSGQNVIKKD